MENSKPTIFRKSTPRRIHYKNKDTEETKTKNEEPAETFNSFLSSMVDNLKIEYDINRPANVSTHPDPVMQAIETFKYHPSVLKIKEFMTPKGMSFSFGSTTQEKTYKTLQNLDKKKHVKKMTSL